MAHDFSAARSLPSGLQETKLCSLFEHLLDRCCVSSRLRTFSSRICTSSGRRVSNMVATVPTRDQSGLSAPGLILPECSEQYPEIWRPVAASHNVSVLWLSVGARRFP